MVVATMVARARFVRKRVALEGPVMRVLVEAVVARRPAATTARSGHHQQVQKPVREVEAAVRRVVQEMVVPVASTAVAVVEPRRVRALAGVSRASLLLPTLPTRQRIPSLLEAPRR
jgi:hypothetical protein